MAYSYNPKDEEELKKQDPTLGAQGGIVGGGSGPSGQTEGSGQYTNLQSYLDTNKNSGLGMGIAENVGNFITGAEDAQSKLNVDFRGAVDKGSVSKDMGNIESVIKNPWAAYNGDNQPKLNTQSAAGIGGPTDYGAEGKGSFSNFQGNKQYKTGLPQERLTPPNFQAKSQSTEESEAFPGLQKMMGTTQAPQASPALTTTNYINPVNSFQPTDAVSKFKAQRDAVYGGPTENTQESFFQPARRATSEASELGRIAGSEQGNRALLKKYYQGDRPDYTEGQLNLDSLLARDDQGAKQAILDQQGRAAQLGSKFSNLQGQLGAYRDQRTQDTQDARNAARGAIGIGDQGGFLGTGPIQNILDATNKRSKESTDQYQADVPLLRGALRGKDISGLSDAYKTKLGLGDVGSLYNIDPSRDEYLKFSDPANLTQSGVATQDELNNLNALSDLGDLNQQWLDPSQTGKGSGDVWNYDTGKFKSDLAGKRADYEKGRKGLQFVGSGADSIGMESSTQDIDDLLAHYQRIGSNQPFGTAGPGKIGTRMGKSDRANKLNYENYQSLINELMRFENQGGARQLLKGSNVNQMDLSEDQKNDLLRGWISPSDMYGKVDNSKINDLSNLYSNEYVTSDANRQMGGRFRGRKEAAGIEEQQSARGLQDYNALQAMMGDTPGGVTGDYGRFGVGYGGKASGLPTNIPGVGTQEERLIDDYRRGNFAYGLQRARTGI